MSAPDHRVTRRGVVAGLALAGLVRHAVAEDAPFAERFVTFDPPVPLQPTALLDRKGRARILAPRPGRLGLVALWATWCPACRSDLPRMAAAQRALGREGFDVSAVNVDADPLGTVLAHAVDIETGTIPLFFDRDGAALARAYADGRRSPLQRFGMPILYLVDRDGLVRGYVKGSVDWSDPAVTTALLAIGQGSSTPAP